MAQQSLLALSNGSSSSNGPLSSHLTGSMNTSIRPNGDGTPKQSIERGASWSYNETRILLSLWGQDMVQRQLTNSKRTRHVWEKIAERIKEHGFERTPDQVRTRVFNMIAEYRRILKNPSVERKKKCIFFDALHKIYQAKDANGVRAALNNYEEEMNLEPLDFNSLDETHNDTRDFGESEMMEMHSGSDNEERSEIFSYAMSPSQLNGISALNGNAPNNKTADRPNSPTCMNQFLDALRLLSSKSNMDAQEDHEMMNGGGYKRFRSDNGSSNPVHGYHNHNHTNNIGALGDCSGAVYDSQTSAVLIDRMFAHLSRETEVMREWVVLERERLAQELNRRREDAEREERREQSFLQTLVKMQQQMFEFLSKQQLIKPEAAAAASAELAATVAASKHPLDDDCDDSKDSD